MATQKLLIIDTHVHVWEMPPVAPIGPTAPSWKSLPREHGNIELLLSDIQANKVDRAVIVQTSWSTWDNTYLSQASHRYPDKFVAMGLIDPQSIDNSITAVKWMDNYGIQGFRFHPMYYDNFEILICPGNRAMFKEIEKRNGKIQIHCRPEHAYQLNQVAKEYPEIIWIIDHMMYPSPSSYKNWTKIYDPVLSLSNHDNVYMKISDIHNRSKVNWPFRDMHEVIKKTIDTFGIDKCIWGTGYPGHLRIKHGWLSLHDEIRLIREDFSWLTSCEKRKLLGLNALKLWKWKVEENLLSE